MSKATIIISGNTSIAESLQVNLQIVIIGQLKSILEQIENNQKAFNTKITDIRILRLKMLTIERFNRTKLKLKGFFTQIRLKLYNKGHKVFT